ncbi:MAG: hypothetical protein R2825_18095 [Saprospiraceae bacterium]
MLFQNTDIKEFASKVQVKLGQLLQDDVREVAIQVKGDDFESTNTQSLILNGTYEERDGVKSYIFEQSKSNKFHLDSNILHFMEIERASFDTVSTEGGTVQSRFSFLGNINFEILTGKDDDGNETQLDLFSFGSEAGEEGFDIGKGLHFSNLHLDMTFPLADPTSRDFDMVVKYFKLGIENSYSRKDGLFTQFPLGFQNFIFGTGAKLPTDYGFEPVLTPAIETTGFSGEWLGLKYKINLGTPGMLASTGAFDAELLLAWSPQGKEDNETYRLYLGILLPGAAGNSKALSLQGILGLNVDTVTLNFDKKSEEQPGAYILSLDDISLRFFNFKMVPPTVPPIPGIETPQANAYLFANRKEGEVKKNIGWLMAYKGPDTSELTGVTIPFIALGQHVALSSTKNINSVSDAIEAMKSAFFPAASDESDFGYEIVYNFEFGEKNDQNGSEEEVSLVFSDESSWLIAFEFGLLAKVPKKDKDKKKKKKDDSDNGKPSGSKADDGQPDDNGDKEEEEEFDDFAVELAVVFNDPEIYGLRLSLGGEAMKVFDGLEFEILYKKVTDSVGVYKILFTLPDQFRKFEVGAAKLTLPVLGLDIYTNGDFKVDLGFPYDLDFSRSFAIEVQAGPFPLVGSAGFYFGKLSGETALMLPDIKKTADGKAVGRFGTVIIFGFGFEIGFGKSIEKGVLSASFKITLVAVVEGVVAPFIPDASLFPAQASSGNVEETNYYWVQGTIGLVGILQGEVDFVVISASVYVRVYALIEATFEAYRPVPIVLKAGVTVQASIKILFVKIKFSFSATISAKITVGEDRWHLAPWNTLPSSSRMAFAAMQARDAAMQVIDFRVTAADFSGTENDLSLLFSLQPTISDKTGKVSYVALLLLDSKEFKQLSDDVLTWVVKSYRKMTAAPASDADLSLAELETIRECLNNAGPSRSEIYSFLKQYYNLSIVGLKPEAEPEAVEKTEVTIFPMLPTLKMKWTGNDEGIDFSTHNEVAGDYLSKVKEFLKALALDVEGLDSDAAEASLATHIFEDYFHLMAKHLVDEAIESFENYSFPLDDSTTLQGVADRLGVSIENIAEQNKLHPWKGGSSFYDEAVKTGKTIAVLANENKGKVGLFDHVADDFLGVKGIAKLDLADLLEDLDRNNVSSNLAGMVARYQLSGLRLPDKEVGTVDTFTKHFPLFDLTGQQFALPDNLSDNFDITLSCLEIDDWLDMGGDGKSLTISQSKTEVDDLRDGFEAVGAPFTAPNLERLPSFEKMEQRFNFKRFSAWNSNSLIWHFPDTMMSHLYTNSGGNLKVRYGVFNEAKQRLEYFNKAAEWGTLVEVTIKRKPGQNETNLRYELIGTDEIGITLLERLLLSGEEILGGNIQILYDDKSASSDNDTPETFGGDKKSLQSLDISAINTFITQANLSTETNPIELGGRMAMVRGVEVPHGILNNPEEFVRLIWECSIVRSGGYYLFYQDLAAADPKGLPDAIFDGDGVAKLSVLIKSESGVPANFSNCAVTDSSIDAANSMVFAEDATQTYSVALLPQSVVSYELLRDVPDEPNKPTLPVLPSNPTAEQQAQYTAALAVYNDELAKYYDDFLENIYQLLAFQVDGGSGGFDESLMSVPIGPANDVGKDDIDEHDRKSLPPSVNPDGKWHFKLAVPLARFATDFDAVSNFHGEPNPYAGIGHEAKLKMTWRDLYGNQALGIEKTESIGNLGYTDELLSIAKWPNVTANYEFDRVSEGHFKLNIHLRYTAPDFGVNDQVSDDTKQAARDNRIREAKQKFAKIYYQLNQPGVKVSILSSFFESDVEGEMGAVDVDSYFFNGFLDGIYEHIDDPQGAATELTIAVPFSTNEINPASIFELEVGLKFQRKLDEVDNDFKASPNVASTIGMVQPILGIDKANAESMQDKPLAVFAQDFEEAFAKENIKIATGINKEDLNTTQRRQDVWVVKMNDLTSEIGDTPLYLAVKPLSTKLTTERVDVYKYATGEGLKFEENRQSFSDIDLDVWAQQFLEAVDDFLSPEMSTSAFLVDKILAAARAAEGKSTDRLGEITADKRTLAEKIVSGLTPVWTDAGTPSTAQMGAAREKLKQQLLIKLRQAYLVNTVVQFGVGTDGGFTLEGKPVRLYGKPFIVSGDGAGSGDRNFSFSNAKVQLDAEDAFLTFLFDTKQDQAKATVEFDLNYKITHLEYRIQDSDQMEGYEISSWLMFVNPVDASDASSPLVKPLGHLEIPVVLRNFPTPPTLVRQFGEQSKEEDDKSALANATQWDYGFTYTQRAAAQDTLKAGVTLNSVPESMAMSRAMLGGRSFFEELATFIAHYPAIQADLASTLPTIHANTLTDDSKLATASSALDAFHQLVDAVTLAWPQYDASGMAMASRNLDTMKLNVRFDFEIQEYSRDGSNVGEFLTEVTPGEISYPVELDTPVIRLAGFTHEIDLGESTAEKNVYKYADIDWQTAKGIAERTAVLENLSILEWQNAVSEVSITRNEDLLEGKTTRSEFIYNTPAVKFPNKIVPLLDNDQSVNIAKIGTNKRVVRTLAEHLQVFFKELMDRGVAEDNQLIKLECLYSYKLRVEDQPKDEDQEKDGNKLPNVKLPVLLVPPYDLQLPSDWNLEDENSFVNQLAKGISTWFNEHLPSDDNVDECFLFDVSIFSKLTDSKLPILRLRGVFLDVDDVSDLQA